MTFRRLLRYLRPHAGRIAATISANVGAALLDVLSLTLLIPFLDEVFQTRTNPGPITAVQRWLIGLFSEPGNALGSLSNIIVVILVAVALKNLLVWAGGQWSAQVQEFVTRDLRNAFYAHVQRLPLGFFTRTRAGQILSRVLTDTQQSKQVVTEAATRSIQSAAVVSATIVVCFVISWRLTLLSLVVAPILIALLFPLLRKLRKGHRRLGDQYGDMTSVVQEAVTGMRLVKSFRGEAYEQERFVGASDRYARGMIRVQRLGYLAQPITETVGTAIAVVILGVGAREVLVTQTMSAAQLITFLLLVMRMLQPLKQLSQVPTIAQQSLAAAERLFDIMDQPTETLRDRGTRRTAALDRELRFENVSFAYDAEPVLHDLSFTVRKGEIVALVGPSGAGKSTLVDLIPRFYEPTGGRILLDGIDTREIMLPALRALTGIVSQDTVLFNDTVRNNIAYAAAGSFSASDVEAAARAANAHDFIAALPNGYDTVLGERGTRLSGGQRQRLAIARALLIDPPILILDEATSALDTESERLVQQAIDRLLAGRTVFVIAHRLSTVQHATQILVLDAGRIVERGTHETLLADARSGVYRRLHAVQFGEPLVPIGVGA
ncbi:MAG: ABC transporter ATP-binding protein [Gemmatimonadaceae bacterium]